MQPQAGDTRLVGIWMNSDATVLGKAGVTYFIILEALEPCTASAKHFDLKVATACRSAPARPADRTAATAAALPARIAARFALDALQKCTP